MSENEEPDWLAELAKGGDAVRRQIELLVQGAQQFVRDGQQGTASGGPVPPFQQRVVRAVGAAVRELGSARQPVVHQRSAALNVNVAVTATAAVATAGGLALNPTVFVSSGDVATASEDSAVKVPGPSRGADSAAYGQVLFLVLLWLVVLLTPLVVMDSKLSPGTKEILIAYDGIFANLAVAITFKLIEQRHK
jgi:hypothetical protein